MKLGAIGRKALICSAGYLTLQQAFRRTLPIVMGRRYRADDAHSRPKRFGAKGARSKGKAVRYKISGEGGGHGTADHALEDLVITVEKLTSPETGCPWNAEKTVEDYLSYVCSESDEALHEIEQLSAYEEMTRQHGSGDMGDREEERARIVRSLTSELGDVLYVALVVVSKAGHAFGLEPYHAYKSAVEKIRGRTPYMTEWGDGSEALTLERAQALWLERKQLQKETETHRTLYLLSTQATPAKAAAARSDLVYTVSRLVAGGCPWTESINASQMLQFLKEECVEAMEELDTLCNCSDDDIEDDQENCRSHEEVRRALVSELGDVLFDALMAIFLAARDHSFDPAEAYESAVTKIRSRTPYIKEWGDGSVAHTPQEAEAMWNVAKKRQKEEALKL
mmetsp:Transcript_37647/g.45416  ORF Transcript_37647/g.45416 Transcript_37647/m.45416 type:complete len:395 (-) Transcript_37647:320-1504(-)|eukprot:CAMPEP_0197863272 /NCGR_PEP_ID=MMETSP1438-20131217/40595_1 /TAXON_ID=1461541 /ORGANISM="Pterosperma sp., Strain CCMP1384" /LENGTH=394 /DNA_ID=CAMNT_0043481099 /DNA_START=266 /DNA_END=1450 /DNA_ORIENTATION=+